jgi:hypothetical protein
MIVYDDELTLAVDPGDPQAHCVLTAFRMSLTA